MKIYTKKGDEGNTSLYGGTPISKAHIRVEAYGTVDELNAHIAYLRDTITGDDARGFLLRIQNELFVLGGMLALPENAAASGTRVPAIGEEHIRNIEEEIDRYQEQLPVQKHFILPGGHPAVSTCHIARNVCRRAERRCVQLHEVEPLPPVILQYLNRLSDYLFVLARKLTYDNHGEEIQWKH